MFFLHQRPGNPEHFSGQLHTHLGFDTALTLAAAKQAGKIVDKVSTAAGGHPGSLIQGIAQLAVAPFGDLRDSSVAVFAAVGNKGRP